MRELSIIILSLYASANLYSQGMRKAVDIASLSSETIASNISLANNLTSPHGNYSFLQPPLQSKVYISSENLLLSKPFDQKTKVSIYKKTLAPIGLAILAGLMGYYASPKNGLNETTSVTLGVVGGALVGISFTWF